MAKRYYLCDIIGTGQEITRPDGTAYIDAYRPSAADHGVEWTAPIPTHPDTGQPLFTWTLALVAARNHSAIRADPRSDAMPDFPLDGKVNGIEAVAKAAMKAAIAKRGLNANAIVDGKDGYREVIRALGKSLEPAFDENASDVTDV